MNIRELAEIFSIPIESMDITDSCLNDNCCSCEDNVQISKIFANIQNQKNPPNKNYKWECKITFESIGGVNIEFRLSKNIGC